jgi:large subunit ribosomal protein L4
MEAIRTRELLDYLEALESATGQILVVAPERDEKLELSARNLPHVTIILADSLNSVDILKATVLLITQPALAAMTEVYA